MIVFKLFLFGLVVVMPTIIAADLARKQWPGIVQAYSNIGSAYPYAISLFWFWVAAAFAGFSLFIYVRWTYANARRTKRMSLETEERKKIREELAAEIMPKLEARKAGLEQMRKTMTEVHSKALAAAEARRKEYEKLLSANSDISDNLSDWMMLVDCASEALVEDHEMVVNMHGYLARWIAKAVSAPNEFIVEISNGGFDSKRFERCTGKLDDIHARFTEIRKAMEDIKDRQQVG